MKLEIELNKVQGLLLESLKNTGLYGASTEDVAMRILDAGLRHELKEGAFPDVLETHKEREKCPHCGSPHLRPPITMGPHDFECTDCGRLLMAHQLT